MEYDYLIIGSGFGGAVSALRLVEKGWSVAVAEQGRRIGPREIEQAREKPMNLYWEPKLRARGHFVQHIFRHIAVVGGVGVGGGSLVWGSVMLPPKDSFYEAPEVRDLGLDLRAELKPHIETAQKAFGVTRNPRCTQMDQYLRQTAEAMGVGDSFGPVPNAIYFGETGKTVPDPYFDGEGPERTGCSFCASCMTGCPYGSKNSLDYNYLYLAERKGARIIPQVKAQRITPRPGGGYDVTLVDPLTGAPLWTVFARKLILSAGVVGTLELLFRNRDEFTTLPNISRKLGDVVRTNSEAVVAVLHPPGTDLSDGTGISSDFYPNAHTHITQNRFHRNFRLMRFSFGPLVDGERPGIRALRTLAALLTQVPLVFTNWFCKDWENRITILTVMQDLDDKVRMEFRRRWWWPLRARLNSAPHPDGGLRSYLPEANQAARELARVSGGRPLNNLYETLGQKTVTAHILGGCPMGVSATEGVIDSRHEVHCHPGLFVVDGSSIPANIGVNPSLTIAAMAERFAALQPDRRNY